MDPAGPVDGDGDPAADVPNGGPGATRIAGRVVERIATRTVAGLDRATGSSRHLLGVRVGSLTADTPARVDATVDGDLATVRVSMAVRWPESVRQVTRQARDQITSDVTRWTGLRVAQVDIAVPELLRGPVDPPASGSTPGEHAPSDQAPGEQTPGEPIPVEAAPAEAAGVH